MSTVAVKLTGDGRSAVATVVVDGPDAIDVVTSLFDNSTVAKRGFQVNKTYFGNWEWKDYREELVVCRTDNERIEVHCHGGRVAPTRILESLRENGIAEITTQQWLLRTESDPFVRAAVELLAEAKTERVLCILLDQTRGAMRRALESIRHELQREEYEQAKQSLESVIAMGDLGLRLTRPFAVVLHGPPNTGKSSLINALLGFERAIVYDQPGTTRDLVTAETAIDGWSVEFTDTAGIRESSDQIEQAGIQLAKAALSGADLVLEVVDLSASGNADASDGIASVQRESSDALVLRVGTKHDLALEPAVNSEVDVRTSAVTGDGISELMLLIVRKLVPAVPASGDAIPLSVEALAQLTSIARHVSARDGAAAVKELDSLLHG